MPTPLPSKISNSDHAERKSTNQERVSPSSELRECRVVAIDDDPVALYALERHLLNAGCQITTASDGQAGLNAITDDVTVALIDLRMPGLNGLDCLRILSDTRPNVSVIILTASSEVSTAVDAMKQGAFQYLTKPFKPDELLVHVSKAHKTSIIASENTGLREAMSLPEASQNFRAEDSGFSIEQLKVVQRFAKMDSTVFIGGESGTGKTTVARMIHQGSTRANAPFVSVNCASLPRDLIESELFGHAKGAFTGAVKDRIGKAEIADGGTLFLDEIGDLPLDLQPKLLTFLQDRVIQRVGCNVVRNLDIRVIVATHRDLGKMCDENRFRQDLYYRLNVLMFYLQPLRERPESIPKIAKIALERLCHRDERTSVHLSDEAIDALQKYPWPGNIRELENVLERAIAFSDSGLVTPSDLKFDSAMIHPAGRPSVAPNSSDAFTAQSLVGMTLEEIEKEAILKSLESCSGNKAKSARMLGISEKSIYNKMKRLNITPAASKSTEVGDG